jgi:hypothetical protein
VSFGKSDGTVYATNAAAILKQNGVDAKSMTEAPEAWPVKKPRIGIYQPWSGNIDEGWTRWILEQFHFPFTVLHNPDVRDGHLRDRYDTIVFAEMATRQIMDGARAGTVPGQYAGGIGDEGAQALRDFVTAGGTLVTMGNAASFAIDEFNLPVANALAGLRQDQFFCSGALLRVEIPDPKHPVVAGLPAMPAVMFERNQAFDTRPAFRGRVLASYVKDRNPLVITAPATSLFSGFGRSGADRRTALTNSSLTLCTTTPRWRRKAAEEGGAGVGAAVAAVEIRSRRHGGERPSR